MCRVNPAYMTKRAPPEAHRRHKRHCGAFNHLLAADKLPEGQDLPSYKDAFIETQINALNKIFRLDFTRLEIEADRTL